MDKEQFRQIIFNFISENGTFSENGGMENIIHSQRPACGNFFDGGHRDKTVEEQKKLLFIERRDGIENSQLRKIKKTQLKVLFFKDVQLFS